MRTIALAPMFIFGYMMYFAIYPDEEFYREDFKEVTGVALPQNAEIIYKSASYPDHFGDYASVSIINVGQTFYTQLPAHLMKKGLHENQEVVSSSELYEATVYIKGKFKIAKEYYKTDYEGPYYYYVGLMSDNKTIIVHRASS